MTGDSTIILGIEIPSTDPVFIGVIVGSHIPLGLAGVVAGAVAMLSEKRRGRHWTAGKVYYWCLLALSGSATFYVDNGKQLPLWKDLPHFTYWLLPLTVGIPLIVRAVLWHPVARKPILPYLN
jgi:hypothetical protein